MSNVGVIVNPWAGKDLRRLHAAVGQTPDTAKIGTVRRVVVAALAAGADKVFVADDMGRIAARAIDGLDGAVLVDGPSTGSALDTRRAAAQLDELGCGVVVVLGGDGTCRDVTMGWPDVTLIGLSTGTNNVFPVAVDGSSAGTAAALVATGTVDRTAVTHRAKRLVVEMSSGERDIALVDIAVIDAPGTGARAVIDATTVRTVIAAVATPLSTGLSSVAGRAAPLGAGDEGASVVSVGPGGRTVSVPLIPGRFDDLPIAATSRLAEGDHHLVTGPCVLAYDGERDRVVRAGATATISVDRCGPVVVDVAATLDRAAADRLFDRPTPEDSDGH